MRSGALRGTLLVLGFVTCLGSAALANHKVNCTHSGGTSGPGQLDCSLPDFLAHEGSTTILTSSFAYTPSTDFDPVTCAVGMMSVMPAGQWLSIGTNTIDTSAPPFFQEVEVSVDPTGLTVGIYTGTVRITLTSGSSAPNCPLSSPETMGQVFVRLVVLAPLEAPALNVSMLGVVAFALCSAGFVAIYRRRRA